MSTDRTWTEGELAQLGLLIAEALSFLEVGVQAAVELQLRGKELQIANDPVTNRVVIFQSGRPQQDGTWH